MSQAYQTFKTITLQDVKNFSLQEALKNVGLSLGMSAQQRSKCESQLFFLQQRIDRLKETDRLQRQLELQRPQIQQKQHDLELQRLQETDRLQRQLELKRLQRQNETLQIQQPITKFQKKNEEHQKIIRDQEAERNRREQNITLREQAITQCEQAIAITLREQAITRREQAIAITQREQNITQREQNITQREKKIAQRESAIRSQETQFYLKEQFLAVSGIALLSLVFYLALGWKKQDEPGYYGLVVGLVMVVLYAIAFIILLIMKRIRSKESKVGFKALTKVTGIIEPNERLEGIEHKCRNLSKVKNA